MSTPSNPARPATPPDAAGADGTPAPLNRPLALVTGASRGIGLELARQFARHGFDLVIVADTPRIQDAAAELRAAGAQVDALVADLATIAGVEKTAAAVEAAGRPLAVAALNAGVGLGGAFVETDIEEEIGLINLNVTGTVHLAKYVTRLMVRQGEGRILITSSLAADLPGPYEAVYSASKAFLLSFAEALRVELADRGITVTALQPGATDTNFFHRAHMEDSKLASGKLDDPADVAEDAFDALMAGADHVVAGSLRNRIQATVAQVTPEPLKARLHGSRAKPGSAKE